MESGHTNNSKNQVIIDMQSIKIVGKFVSIVCGVFLGAFVLFQSWQFYNFKNNTLELWPVLLYDMKSRLPEIKQRMEADILAHQRATTPTTTVPSTTLPPKAK